MFLKTNQRYHAYTLLELLVVLSIFSILGAMTFSSFGGLQNTVKMNEYMLNLEQDVRSVQRQAMLLERSPNDGWPYGLGIDFSQTTTSGTYKIFKWCSPFMDYGNTKTKADLPAYDPNVAVGISRNAYLPADLAIITQDTECNSEKLATLAGYDISLSAPKADITINLSGENQIAYVVFESISGRAFFYDTQGILVNYNQSGEQSSEVVNFELTVDPQGTGKTRKFIVNNLSGKITTEVL